MMWVANVAWHVVVYVAMVVRVVVGVWEAVFGLVWVSMVGVVGAIVVFVVVVAVSVHVVSVVVVCCCSCYCYPSLHHCMICMLYVVYVVLWAGVDSP